MFVCAAAIVFVIGYRYVWAYPVATTICGVVALATLARWYAVARHADDLVVNRTVRKLSFFVVALVLVLPYLLSLLMKP